ncbi:MAG TPA: sigma 54-interacting transcriptional regulator [Terriglobales bacterium]|nr:sigma 54-interacting transcriptional regulator [Terriglobales bacterium]
MLRIDCEFANTSLTLRIHDKVLRMSSQAVFPMPLPDSTRRQALALRAWELVSSERHLQGVLEAISEVLLPTVAFNSLGIVSFHDGKHDLYAMHVVGVPHREGESMADFMQRVHRPAKLEVPAKPFVPMDTDLMCQSHSGIPYSCEDVLAKDAWYEHDFALAAGGVRAYCAVPLLVRSKFIGVAVFSRLVPVGFTDAELRILCDVSRALAVAVSNAVANEEIRSLRERLEAENAALRTALGQMGWAEDIIGNAPAIKRVLDAIEQVADTDATILITGETGTGKELVARAIHRRSARAQGPLIKVNCSAIPETLLASELFGHERGAFTGAAERRKGRFEQAHGGTLFLDEIGEMPLETQVMLLRVLQEREFERVGGNQTVQVDTRIVAATNRRLHEQVSEGKFRSDLYYRLNVFPIHVPSLQERSEDVPVLIGYFADKYAKRFGRKISRIDIATAELLQRQSWPGNVRELENLVERAVILSRDGVLRVDPALLPATNSDAGIDVRLRASERREIEAALQASHGKISGPHGAARRLGIPASTLEFRIRRLGLDKFQYRKQTIEMVPQGRRRA